MLKKILVPLDGSTLAEQALKFAVDLSIPTGAVLVLMRAAYSHTLPGVDAREREAGAIQEAQDYLTQTADALTERGYECQTLVPFGHPAECIVEQARLDNVDLIVMSTHGRTGPGRWIFGSVAESVVSKSPVPVLVTRAMLPFHREPFLPEEPRLVVPLDGSAFAESALAPAIVLADDLGGTLILVRGEADNEYIGDAHDYLVEAQARLCAELPPESVRLHVSTASAADAIDAAVSQFGASVVVMSTHGRGGVMRAVAGSVASEVVRRGQAPVILIHPSTLDDATEDRSTVVVEVPATP
jgi:nucleotide-binding universal stress UspA family protein